MASCSGKISLRFSYCRNCDKKTLFLLSGNKPIESRCMSCGATELSIFLVSTLKQLELNSDLDVYELSYHGAVFDYLRNNYRNFHYSEYTSSQGLGESVNGVRNEDVQRLTFSSNKMGLITSTEVFEHVPNYLVSFREVYRVLAPGGLFAFTVPLFEETETKPIARLSEDGAIDWIDKAEYHDSRVTGPATVPVFWHHSSVQILRDLVDCGFQSAEIMEDEQGLSLQKAKVVMARKAPVTAVDYV
jgi:SAM-dependent methyltransferase